MRAGVDAMDLANSLSHTQYQSKKWLIDHTTAHAKTDIKILILGGWYGSYLVPMLIEKIHPTSLILSDVNKHVLRGARILHNHLDKVKTMVIDVNKDPLPDADIVINTSCEHMHTLGTVKNKQCLYVYQSCDSRNDPGHINPSHSSDHLAQQGNLSKILYKGRLDLGHKNRFMVIGYKGA